MTGYLLDYSAVRIRAAEADYLFRPFTIRGPSNYGVIACHALNSHNEFADTNFWQSAKIAGHIAHAGIPLVAGTMSGNSWANDASMTDMDNALTLLAESGCSTGKVHLFGVSMGCTQALRWAGQNPTLVASIEGLLPATDIDRLYQSDAGGTRASIGTAWGVTYPTALPAGADLTATYATIDANNIPVRLHYSTNDGVIDPADVIADAALMGATAISMGAAGGHGEIPIGVFNALGSGNSSDYITFLQTNGA